MYLTAQIIGFVAMILSAISFQMNTKKKIIIMQILTSVVFAIHYFMLPEGIGVAAGVVNMIAIVRNVVFFYRDKPIFRSRWWVVLFAAIMGGSAIVSRPEVISVLMCIGMVFNTLSVAAEKPISTRRRILISSPFVLVYNIAVGSIGGIINELLVEILTVVTLIREKNEH